MRLFLIDNGPKGIINIDNKERVGFGLFVQFMYGLNQQHVVEINKFVISFIAVCKGGTGGSEREAPQWFKGSHRYFSHSKVIDAFHVHRKLTHNAFNEIWKTLSGYKV